ncbi:Phs1p [Microsporum canis CBS 113480]|uniref:Very-long-chain (3R)-3-hydroxyacyl-CoA dehydratase n=1 Tax=Arthroderma otae (strain ATCC MYA-4605 / CBS 113480) TaxID=554155 RepID=C5FR88_ARTOC|nr:Phs1p [Microsporum canis CBS 113480]EEQ32391.1 Phs1p [Microsporum canis CBS 113480]
MARSGSSTPVSSPTQAYLFLYNLVSLGLWGTLTFRLFSSLFRIYNGNHGGQGEIVAGIFVYLFPLLQTTQSLAALEILHSLFGLVRASVMTTAMQVASRLLLVWGVMYVFSPFSPTLPIFESAGTGLNKYFLLGHGMRSAQLSDWGFIGCLFAWGVTECIRYGFFVFQILGQGIPKVILWLRFVSLPPAINNGQY